jgi:hypothetical protein
MRKMVLATAAGLAISLVASGTDPAAAQNRTTLDIYVVDVEGGPPPATRISPRSTI